MDGKSSSTIPSVISFTFGPNPIQASSSFTHARSLGTYLNASCFNYDFNPIPTYVKPLHVAPIPIHVVTPHNKWNQEWGKQLHSSI